MAKLVSKKFIHELIYQSNIIDIINKHISLKKSGKNYISHCPFHQEKTPSFTVNFEKQFYFCFGCNSHGNVIDFLMNYEKLTFIESIEELATINGINVPYKSQKNHVSLFDFQKRNNLYLLLNNIANIYHNNLLKCNYAYKYIQNRGITKSMIQFFKIGFSTIDWSVLKQQIKKKYYDQKEMIDIGILIKNKEGIQYDRFKNRIIFPIRNKHGKILGFGGRSCNNMLPKYLNSPETKIFHKSRQLYGLYEMNKTNPNPKEILVVEGYIDVITLFQFKINYSVSTLGLTLSTFQIKLLFQLSNTIIFCFDGDESGKNAAWKALNKSLPYIHDGKNIKFIFLPNNEDPDSIIKKEGYKNFKNRIKNSINFSDMLIHNLFKNININSIRETSYTSKIIITLINKIPGKITKLYLFQLISKKIGIYDYNILKILHTKQNTNKKINTPQKIKKNTIRILISLLIQNPWLSSILPSFKYLENTHHIPGLSFFLKLVQQCLTIPNCNTAQILENYRKHTILKYLKEFSTWDHMIKKQQIKEFFLELCTKIHKETLKNKLNQLIHQERKIGLNKEEKLQLWSISKKLSKI
ncbi:MAG: DNA primase [Buchnera aphidicola (Chaetogeoica yunlongensis)]